jgi:NADPH-dependent 7-cyano-7-deazaguanine reductase QueF
VKKELFVKRWPLRLLAAACKPFWVEVVVAQKPRGGVKLVAKARVDGKEK